MSLTTTKGMSSDITKLKELQLNKQALKKPGFISGAKGTRTEGANILG